MAKYCFWFKIVSLALFCILNIYLFVISCGISYQYALAQEHIKFRQEMPTMDSWVNSPFGKLKNYVFNVTNAEAFLSGNDSKIKLEQVGPIVYKIVGYNDVLNRTEDSITYRKHRYHEVEFLPEESVSPDILNKTIVQFNTILLGAAVKCSQIPFGWMGFNPVTLAEQVFLSGSIYYFLWEYTRPTLQFFSKMVPLETNCGTLYNALKEKEEVYKVNIGTKHGVKDFFRIQSLNQEHLIPERTKNSGKLIDESCPIDVQGTLDNSLFPPFVTKDTPLKLTASESCRVLPLYYQKEEQYEGITGYHYIPIKPNETAPSCMDSTYGIPLPLGMFDVSKCVINEAPTAFSVPHFYGTSYDWSAHFEGLNPNVEEHQPYILLEPITGIPMMEKYRFQTNTPLPDMRNFRPHLQRLRNMIVPTFWYEFDMGQLPDFVFWLIRINVKVVPVAQPIIMMLQLLSAVWSALCLLRVYSGSQSYRELYRKICGTPSGLLETTLNLKPQHDPTQAVK